jgi:Fe-S cluster assembly iron-binding protein IscA
MEGLVMLVLTPAAVEVVNAITTVEGWPDGSGLRIATAAEASQEGGLLVEVVRGPAEHDQVLAATGARVFLEPEAASYLDDKVLNAEVDEQGGATFTLLSQSSNHDAPQV